MNKVQLIIDLPMETYEDRKKFERISKLIANPNSVTSVLERFHAELIRPVNKHGYNDPELQTLSEKDGAPELINLLWMRYYEIIQEEGLEDFLE